MLIIFDYDTVTIYVDVKSHLNAGAAMYLKGAPTPIDFGRQSSRNVNTPLKYTFLTDFTLQPKVN